MPTFLKNTRRRFSLLVCLCGLVVLSSCISGSFSRAKGSLCAYKKHLGVGFYQFEFVYMDGDSEIKPRLSWQDEEKEKLHLQGLIEVYLNGKKVHSYKASAFSAVGSASDIRWALTRCGVSQEGAVEIVISGPVSSLVSARGLKYHRYVK